MKVVVILASVPLLLIGGLLAWFTANKIHGMKQIRGIALGAIVEKKVITAMDENHYRVSWSTSPSIREPGNHRLNLPQNVWSRYQVGDSIEIVYLPGSKMPFHIWWGMRSGGAGITVTGSITFRSIWTRLIL